MTNGFEEDVSVPGNLKRLIGRHGFSLKKQLGQNFLIDKLVLRDIVDALEVSEETGVLEIGPGAGVVTKEVAQAAKVVVAVEKDQSLRPVLADVLSESHNVDVVFNDFLAVDLTSLWTRFAGCANICVVANLPYYITTPILFHLLESDVPVSNIVVMVQKEVADRLAASPGGKDYGALTVAVQVRASVEKVARVPPSSFFPPPTVESTVVRLRVRDEPPCPISDMNTFRKVVKQAFSTRRKTLHNALAGSMGLGKPEWGRVLTACNIDPSRRGETLDISEFAAIANYVDELS